MSGATLQSQYAEINTYILAILLERKADYVFGQGAFDNTKSNAYLKLYDSFVEFKDNKIYYKDYKFDSIDNAFKTLKTFC